MTRPHIGLTSYGEQTRFGVWDLDSVLLPRTYVDMVAAAGGAPVLLPSIPAAADAVAALDALVVTGGPDVDPAAYGAAPHPRTVVARREREEAELLMLRRALDRGIPLLGVCRGLQVLNVALGGTLVQHVPDAVAPKTPGSRVAAAVGARTLVQCHHHQAVDRLGDGLVVSGRAADGVVEAVEQPDGPFTVGVQWHPEQDAADVRLFAAFVAACR